MIETIQRFRNQLGRKEFDSLEDTWLELVEADVPLQDLLDLVDLVERYTKEESPALLLWVLADSLRGKNDQVRRLMVLRRLAGMQVDQTKLARELSACFHKLYPDTNLLERLIQKAGLGYGQPLRPALAALDVYLDLMPNRVVYDREKETPAEVKKLDLLLERTTVAFFDGAEITLDIKSATTRFRPTELNGYFHQLRHDPSSLHRLVKNNAAEVVCLFLRDTRERAGVRTLKTSLVDLVKPSAWDGFWARARRGVEQHPHVLIHTRPTKTFEWSDKLVAKQTTPTSPVRESVIRLADRELAGLSTTDLVDRFCRLTGFAQRRQLLEQLEAVRPEDWTRPAAEMFRHGRDSRFRKLLEQKLGETDPELWQRLLHRTLMSYHQNPEAFQWLLDNANRLDMADASALLLRVLDLLESTKFRKHWAGLRKAMVADGYHLIDAALDVMDEAGAMKLLRRVLRLESLEEFRREEVAALVGTRFPALTPDANEDVILSSAAGIERARAELKHLLDSEMPKVAEELAQARAHGDLSENYEYKAAKEKRARLMSRIGRLQADVKRARPIVPGEVDTDKVGFGCRVLLKDGSGEETDYALLGPWDSDPDHGIISYLAPLGQRMLGRRVDETFELDGRYYTVKRISLGL
jgi:transcription elongation GreA/GreB family factor